MKRIIRLIIVILLCLLLHSSTGTGLLQNNLRVCLSFNKKLRCRLKRPSARRKTQLIAGLFTSFTTTPMAFLGTTRRGGLLFCPLCVKKTLFRMTKRQFFCLDWAKNKLRRSLLLKDKQTLMFGDR